MAPLVASCPAGDGASFWEDNVGWTDVVVVMVGYTASVLRATQSRPASLPGAMRAFGCRRLWAPLARHIDSITPGFRKADGNGLFAGVDRMLAAFFMVHFLAHIFPRLSSRCLALSFIFFRPLPGFPFWHAAPPI